MRRPKRQTTQRSPGARPGKKARATDGRRDPTAGTRKRAAERGAPAGKASDRKASPAAAGEEPDGRPPSKVSAPAPPLRPLLEDAHLVAVDKPPGILTVPDNDGRGKNLQDAMRRRALRAGEESFPVHRLDRDTTGVLLFAKTPRALETLVSAFRARTVQKTYVALVHGRPREARGIIRTYIAERGMTATSSLKATRGAKEAVTRYETLETFRDATLVLAAPETGRFNQIRVHFADLGCPLVGERKYAAASRHTLRFRRPILHAARLEFAHPASGARTRIEAPLPDDVEAFLESLRERADERRQR